MGIPVSVKKILLVNGWSDLNKGDSGIVYGMINSFKKTLPDVEISLLSGFAGTDYRFIHGHVHLLAAYPQLKVYGSLFPYVPVWHDQKEPAASRAGKFLRKAGHLLKLLPLLWYPPLGGLLLRGDERETWKNFQAADCIVSKGGHIFHSGGGLFSHAVPLLLAIRLQKPFVFYAQSMGPFTGRIAGIFMRWLCSKAALITVREELSKDVLLALKVPAEKIKVVPDAAFALEPAADDDAWQVLEDNGINKGEKFVAITVRQWFFGREPDSLLLYQQYLQAMAQLADYIIEQYRLKVVFMPQVLGPVELENDLLAAHQVYDLITHKSKVAIVEKDFSPSQLLNIYEKAYVFVGTRFHSVIFALVAGTPALAISYYGPKSKGIMKMAGLEDFVLDIGNLTFTALSQRLDRLIQERDAMAMRVNKQVRRLREQAAETPAFLCQLGEKTDAEKSSVCTPNR